MIKEQVIPSSYKLVSFHVKALFTNVPLDRTIDIILERIYDTHEITTNIGRKEMKNLIILFTKMSRLLLIMRRRSNGIFFRSGSRGNYHG